AKHRTENVSFFKEIAYSFSVSLTSTLKSNNLRFAANVKPNTF
ncbi:hypothetical protein D039_2155B, partial [Vibrio parahaemolyticus EKP-028]